MYGPNELLAQTAAWLDIPDEMYEEAVRKYTELGQYLNEIDSRLGRREPLVYPQGSFRLGTMIRPVNDADDYDIDLVYRRDIRKESTTQQQLKREAGANLKAFAAHKEQESDDPPSVGEGRRCWTLKYEGRFHMDVLPAIPNVSTRENALHITDRELREWQDSNPLDYATWFMSRMVEEFKRERFKVAQQIQASVETVPDWRVKTKLQRAVQLLKRHRDLHFQNNEKYKPASIIITTLAAHAYSEESDLVSTLRKIARDMPHHVQRRGGKYYIPNPVHPAENFADRWNEDEERPRQFMRWAEKLRIDLEEAQGLTDAALAAKMARSFGSTAVEKAAASLSPKTITKVSEPSVPALADASHVRCAPWPEIKLYRATVRAATHTLERRRFLAHLNGNRSVAKYVSLRFEVETNAPPPYDVRWQVVNTGREAKEARQLRGEFYEGDARGGRVHWEFSEYAGTHWVEAFIIKNGQTVARSGKFLVRVRG